MHGMAAREAEDRATRLASLRAVTRESGLVHMFEMHNAGKTELELMRFQPLIHKPFI